MPKTITRKRNESDVELMERAAAAAAKVTGSVDAGMGPLCPSCASFGCAEGVKTVEILSHAACYNCSYGA